MTPSRPLELGGRSAELPPPGPVEPAGSPFTRIPRHYLVGAFTAVLLLAVVLAVTLYPRQPEAKAQASGGGDLSVTDQATPSAAATTATRGARRTSPSALPTEVAQRIGGGPVVPRVSASGRPIDEETTTTADETTTPGVVLPAPPVVADQSLPDGQVGQAYSASLTASGKGRPFTWTRTGGSLPDGLALSRRGVVSGTPTAGDSTSFTVRVTDTAGQTATAVVTITVTIKAKAGDLDGDGDVDCTDYSILQAALGTSNAAADLNNDGTVDDQDAAILLAALDAGGDCSA